MATLHGGDYQGGQTGSHNHDHIGHDGGDSGTTTTQGAGQSGGYGLFGGHHDGEWGGGGSHSRDHSGDIVGSSSSGDGRHSTGESQHDGHADGYSAPGHDAFVFTGGGGQSLTVDFQHGDESLHIAANINGLVIHSSDDLVARVTEVQGHAVIDLGHGDSITLHGVSADEVHQNPSAFFTVG